MLVYILKLGFKVRFINIKIEKTNDSIFEIFEMILTSFYLENKFKKT